MIFPLKKVKSDIDKINKVPLYFFEHSLKASKVGLSLFPKWFQPVYTRCPGVSQVFKDTFNAFKKITKQDQKFIIEEYRKSIDVEKICNDYSIFVPCVDDFDPEIQKSLADLFRFLYEHTIDTVSFKNASGMRINDHYDEFFRRNEIHVCPFCGLETYSLPEQRRAEYDHYLPISKYPLFGVNFNNLVPMGDICNGKKNDADILYEANSRRIVLYPYEKIKYALKVNCKKKPNLSNMEGEWAIDIAGTTKRSRQQIKTWEDVFNIKTQFNSVFKRFHKRFIEDLAHKNGLAGKTLSVSQLKQELKSYKKSGIGDPRMETMAILKSAWSDFHINLKDRSQLIVITSMIKTHMPRVSP